MTRGDFHGVGPTRLSMLSGNLWDVDENGHKDMQMGERSGKNSQRHVKRSRVRTYLVLVGVEEIPTVL